jgi:hypothetical protein
VRRRWLDALVVLVLGAVALYDIARAELAGWANRYDEGTFYFAHGIVVFALVVGFRWARRNR